MVSKLKNKSKSKPNICLIYTGGTIGMQRNKTGTLRPPKDPDSFKEIVPELTALARFDFVSLMNKDSTNMNPGDWKEIAQAIYDRRDKRYDGFVIAHGTDTMHFSASAVAFALGINLDFPVVFTGAQTAPDVYHGDARVNLLRAFKVATVDFAEVAICFGNHVFRGCRAQKKDERRFEAFDSPAASPLADITEDIIVSPLAKTRKDKKIIGPIEFQNEFADGIIQVSLIPGLEPALLDNWLYNSKCRGIVLQSFGAGNVPSEAAYALTDFIRKAKKHGKPVLITSQFPANATLHTAYEPGKKAVKAGAIPTGNMTSACATAKFRWVLAQVGAISKVTQVEEIKKKYNLSDNNSRMKCISELMSTAFIEELDETDKKSK